VRNGFSGSMSFFGTSPEPIGGVMDLDESPDLNGQPSDPRRRPPVGQEDFKWDPRPPDVDGWGQ